MMYFIRKILVLYFTFGIVPGLLAYSQDEVNVEEVRVTEEKGLETELDNKDFLTVSNENIEEEDEMFSEFDIENSNHNLTTENGNYSVNANSTNVNNTVIQTSCLQDKMSVAEPVEIVNATRLASLLQADLNITSKQTPANCVLVLFYSPTCPFSCVAAPHFNALSRYFPHLKTVAIDAMTHKIFNAQFGIAGVPTILLFHNGRPAAKLNETSDYSLEMFAKFIKSCTNLQPLGKLVVTSNDFKGPISTVLVNGKDYYLLLSWVVIVLQLLYSFYCSSWGRWLVDATLSTWREAEAQHHHID